MCRKGGLGRMQPLTDQFVWNLGKGLVFLNGRSERRYSDPYLNRIYQQKSEVARTRTTFSFLNQRGEGLISSHRETDDDSARQDIGRER